MMNALEKLVSFWCAIRGWEYHLSNQECQIQVVRRPWYTKIQAKYEKLLTDYSKESVEPGSAGSLI